LKYGLIGTITYDVITNDKGEKYEGIGGVLYQAAILCGHGEVVHLHTHLGVELDVEVDKIIKKWPTLRKDGIVRIPGPGNQVFLHYPEQKERIEILKTVVPSLDENQVIRDLPKVEFLICVMNSGLDIKLFDWRKIVKKATCPIWLDIHSLPLAKKLDTPREYLSFPKWKEWAKGVNYLQANRKEVACMLGKPTKIPSLEEIECFASEAHEIGVEGVFVTLSKTGAFVACPREAKIVSISQEANVIDTTGCGDVFGAAVSAKLAESGDPFHAATFGLKLATKAVSITGIEETYKLGASFRNLRDSKS